MRSSQTYFLAKLNFFFCFIPKLRNSTFHWHSTRMRCRTCWNPMVHHPGFAHSVRRRSPWSEPLSDWRECEMKSCSIYRIWICDWWKSHSEDLYNKMRDEWGDFAARQSSNNLACSFITNPSLSPNFWDWWLSKWKPCSPIVLNGTSSEDQKVRNFHFCLTSRTFWNELLSLAGKRLQNDFHFIPNSQSIWASNAIPFPVHGKVVFEVLDLLKKSLLPICAGMLIEMTLHICSPSAFSPFSWEGDLFMKLCFQ